MTPQTTTTAVVLAETAIGPSPLVKAPPDSNPCPACGSTNTVAGFWTFECLACDFYDSQTNDNPTDRALRGDL